MIHFVVFFGVLLYLIKTTKGWQRGLLIAGFVVGCVVAAS